MSRPEGCTCQYGEDTPIWYTSVRTCSVHAQAYDASQTPQWWHEQEAANARAEARQNRTLWQRLGLAR